MEAPISKKIIAFGSKQVFLPKFAIALVRTPRLSPYHARFHVPLNFSKYDLRDYLYHAYNVKVFNIRSYVKQMPVRDTMEMRNHWFRPASKKYMTVEMEKPFVWPADPESWEPWGRKEKEEEVKLMVSEQSSGTVDDRREAILQLRRQAREMLGGAAPKTEDETGGKEKEDDKGKEPGKVSVVKNKSLLELWEEKRTSEMLGKRVRD